MKKVFSIVLALVIVGAAFAQTDTQTVTFEVTAVSSITVAGAPSLTLKALDASGTAFAPAVDATSTYAVFTNSTNMKITAQLETALPAGLTLTLAMAAPTGATSPGAVTLSAVAADLVTGISQVGEDNLSLTYELSGTPSAAVGADTRVITFTIVDAGL